MPGDAEAPGGPGGALSPLEASVCRAALDSLMGKGNAKKNYLFLEPVDLAHFPTYTDVVERPMDLGTVGKNLEGGGGYGSMGAFWADVHLVFANAIRFHQPNPEAAWIVKLARDMAKVVERERRKADKKLDARKAQLRAEREATAAAQAVVVCANGLRVVVVTVLPSALDSLDK